MPDQKITDHFGITGNVDFVNLYVKRDNLLFVDPSAIRKAASSGDAYGIDADGQLSAFFDETLRLLRSPAPADHRKGETDLQRFSEIGYTRLGMSKSGFDGHGAAEKLGSEIWGELRRNPLCKLAIATLKYIEDVPLFVDGIDKDVTSDITVKIVTPTLLKFTADMVAKHPEFSAGAPLKTVKFEVWNSSTNMWEDCSYRVPVAFGKPLILVPKYFVNFKLQMTYGQYYGVAVLEYIKWSDTVEIQRKGGTVIRPRFTKKFLKQDPTFAPSRDNAVKHTARIFEADAADVLGDYRTQQQTSFEPLDDEVLLRYIEKKPV